MTVNCYLNFSGNCREAVDFYSKVFDTPAKIMTFGDIPPDPDFTLPEETKKLIMFASIEICGNRIMFSDVTPDRPFVCGNNISISLSGSDKEQLSDWFGRLSEGGVVGMPIGRTFWSELYGFTVDKFGIGWQINYEDN